MENPNSIYNRKTPDKCIACLQDNAVDNSLYCKGCINRGIRQAKQKAIRDVVAHEFLILGVVGMMMYALNYFLSYKGNIWIVVGINSLICFIRGGFRIHQILKVQPKVT